MREKMNPSNKRTSIVMPMFLYWLLLVVWQNIGEYSARSSLAVVIKIILVFFLTISFLKDEFKCKTVNTIVWVLFFGITMILSESNDIKGGINSRIYYYFPVLFSFLTFVAKSDAEINKIEFLKFLKLYIIVVLYMGVYGLLDNPDSFFSFLTISSAYGNEFKSFLVSNHEYAMYVVFAMVAVLCCYKETKHKTLYLCIFIFFVANLLISLSRTAMLACVCVFASFAFLAKGNGMKKWIIGIFLIVIVFSVFVPEISELIEKIILKENDDGGRFEIWENMLVVFKESTLKEKMIGQGYLNTISKIYILFGHTSAHNMYLQILLTYGLIGVGFLIGILLHTLKNAISIYKKKKDYSAIFVGLSFASFVFMLTNTACLMQSPIDSYMLTVFTVVIPKYVVNSIRNDNFE